MACIKERHSAGYMLDRLRARISAFCSLDITDRISVLEEFIGSLDIIEYKPVVRKLLVPRHESD